MVGGRWTVCLRFCDVLVGYVMEELIRVLLVGKGLSSYVKCLQH